MTNWQLMRHKSWFTLAIYSFHSMHTISSLLLLLNQLNHAYKSAWQWNWDSEFICIVWWIERATLKRWSQNVQSIWSTLWMLTRQASVIRQATCGDTTLELTLQWYLLLLHSWPDTNNFLAMATPDDEETHHVLY